MSKCRIGALAAASVGATSLPMSFRFSESPDSGVGVPISKVKHMWFPAAFTRVVKCEEGSAAFRNSVEMPQQMKEIAKGIDIKASMAKCDLFKNMSPDMLASIEKVARRMWFKKGATILEENEINDSLFVFGLGKYGIMVGNTSVASLEKGDCYGETAVTTKQKAGVTIKVKTDPAMVFVISHDDLKEALPPDMWEKLVEITTAKELENVSYEFLKDIPAFGGASTEFLQAIVKSLKLVSFDANQKLLSMGVADTEGMFFIRSGDVSVEDTQGPVAQLKENDVVGEMMLFAAPGMKRSCTVRAKSFVEAYQLTKRDFAALARNYPKDFEAMKETSKSRSRQNLTRATRVRIE